jgi:hypothetical protein
MYRKWTWILVLLAFGGIFLLASSCMFQADKPNRATVEESGVTYSIETDRSAYSQGETVRIVYRITNKTAGVLDLGSVPDCAYCTHQLSITQNGKDIWQGCRIMPPCGFKEFRLDPDASWEYAIDWPMVNDRQTLEPEDDVPVDPGVYHLSGELNSFSDQKRIPVSVSVKITRSTTGADVAPATKTPPLPAAPAITPDVRTPAPGTVEVVFSTAPDSPSAGVVFMVWGTDGSMIYQTTNHLANLETLYLPPGRYTWAANALCPSPPPGCFRVVRDEGFIKDGMIVVSQERIAIQVKLGIIVEFCTHTPTNAP